MIRVLLSVGTFVVMSIVSAGAASHYVRQGAIGTGSGNDWNNAYATLPATLVRSDTYYVAGGSYPAYTFDDPVNGTKYITIKKATLADHGTQTGWNNSYADSAAQWASEVAFRTSYYVFDGQTGGGSGQWRSGFGFRVPYSGGWACLVIGDPGGDSASRESDRSHISIRHVEAWGPVLGGTPCENAGGMGLLNAGGATGHSDLTYSYLWLHDLAIQIQGGLVRNVILEYSCLERNASSSSCHSEAWAAWGPSHSVTVRYNIFSDIEGTGVLVTTNAYSWQVYGNIFTSTPGNPYGSGVGNGIFGTTDHAGEQSDSCQVHNNTFVNLLGGSNAGLDFTAAEGTAVGNEAYNNLWLNSQASVGFSGVTHDYSWFCGNPNNATLVSAESHAQAGTADPFVDWANGDYRLKAATNAGQTLAAPFNMDMFGNTRGADGVWDRGAVEYTSTGVSNYELRTSSVERRHAGEISNGLNPIRSLGLLRALVGPKETIYDLQGNVINHKASGPGGVYLVKDKETGAVMRAMVVR